jgi:hypothetical protein
MSRAQRRTRALFAIVAILSLLISSFPPTPPIARAAGECDPPITNPVACENTLAGNPQSEWDVSGSGDATIQGFATDISVDQGQTVRFKVNTTASDYRLDIYRLGYYGGMGARRVATVQPSAALPQSQPACLNNAATGLVDCGNWAESASWAVPTTAVSGLYLARLVRESGAAGASHVPFVVRDDDGGSDVLFQTSDTTWHAYNSYGGRSLYDYLSSGGRAMKVSYNRPFDTRSNDNGQDWLFHAEYPMIRFLERNGYDVSYTSNVDTDRRGAELLEHRAFLSVGHDEYWSGQQRANVEAARDAGVHLAFFSGNEVFWKVRWENSIDASGTPYRTLVTYKETLDNAKTDPLPNVWTGTWRDPRFSPPADGGRPENALSGTAFMAQSVNAPLRVPEADGKMRFWRGTTVATLGAGQTASIGNAIVGYEFDSDLDNGSRPPGLIRVAQSAVGGASVLTDHGSNYSNGTANHAMTLYKHGSGALVFGAGTIQYAWGLDDEHDNGTAQADPRLQQATVNLFADMGVQPSTLQGGLVAATASTDTTRPTSTITSPAAGASIPQNSNVTITGTAADSGGQVGGVEVSTDGGATWRRATGRGTWSYSWTAAIAGAINIKSRAADDSGNIETPGAGVNVTVTSSDTTPPTISSVQATGITTTGATISWTTNELSNTQVEYGLTTGYGSQSPLAPAFVTAHSQPLTGLTPNTLYHYRVKSRDSAGNLATSADFVFATQATAGSCPCSIWGSATVPATPNENDTNAVEVGVKFRASQAGTITAIRFYKGSLNTGTHVGSLWSASGTLLGRATFTNETASGWQQVNLATPVAVAANTSYVASYHAPVGRYAVNGNYFASATTNGPLTALASATEAPGNGMYRYTATPAFPNSTYNSENYWVDVVYTNTADTTPPTISAVQAGTVTSTAATITWTTNEGADSQVEYGTTTAYGSSTTLDPAMRTGHSQPLAGLTPGTPYNYRVKSRDAAGNLATSANFTFVTAAADTTAPTITNVQASSITSSGATITWSTNEASDSLIQYGPTTAYGSSTTLDPALVTSHSGQITGLTAGAQYHYRVRSRDAAGNLATSADFTFTTLTDGTAPTISAVQATGVTSDRATINWTTDDPADSQVEYGPTIAYGSSTVRDPALVSGHTQPLLGLQPNTTYHYRVRSQNSAGLLSVSGDFTFTTANPTSCPCSIWSSSAVPALANENDTSAIQVGVKFRSTQAGYITGIRFYKGAQNTGTHVGKLWTSTGTQLATATFTNETASGWQQVNFAAPVSIAANTVYVASYHAPNGRYAVNEDFFVTSGVTNGPLTAVARVSATNDNGVYRYGSASGFPNQSYRSENYWVDVVFTTSAP